MKLGKKASERIFAISMVLPALIVLVVLSVYPLLTAVYTSFFEIHTITRHESYVGLKNYIEVLSMPLFWHSLKRSVIWTVSGISVQLVLGIICSLILHADLKGRNLARGIVLFPYLVPAVVASLVWRFMFDPLTGVMNYLLVDVFHLLKAPIAWLGNPKTALTAVIIVGIWKYVPFMIILFLARLQTTPLDLYEAAKVDGANAWQQFWYITLPWLEPTIIIAMLLRTIWLFNHFDVVYLMAFGGPMQSATTAPVLIRTTAFHLMEMGKAASISMYMMLILLCTSVFYHRLYSRAEEELRY